MITTEQKRILLENVIDGLELPESAYEKARERYEDMGEWLSRDESTCAKNAPHVFPQGSFRLGTAIRPLDEDEPYDLDLACKLQAGITKQSHSQKFLKDTVGQEIEAYRVARGISAQKEEKHRCWRLEYADRLSFHMDIVPCIPADDARQRLLSASMRTAGASESLSNAASELAVSITDDRHPGYRQTCDDWNISNPEGYARWFEERMNQGKGLMETRAQVDDIPIYRRKTALQRAIQILKRHRDRMFRDDTDVKPISIIITTLAARAYQGEGDVESALQTILVQMGALVGSVSPRVPNPVNPEEDFTDRWRLQRELNLERHFWNWLEQARIDFELLGSTTDMRFAAEQASQKYAVHMDHIDLAKKVGLINAAISVVVPKNHAIAEASKPWSTRNK